MTSWSGTNRTIRRWIGVGWTQDWSAGGGFRFEPGPGAPSARSTLAAGDGRYIEVSAPSLMVEHEGRGVLDAAARSFDRPASRLPHGGWVGGVACRRSVTTLR